jgi:hypothetical protein
MPVHDEPTDDYEDDDDEADVSKLIRKGRRLVGRQEWCRFYAGTVDVLFFQGKFYSGNEAEVYEPFDTFEQAADAVSLVHVNDATTGIWVDPVKAPERKSLTD